MVIFVKVYIVFKKFRFILNINNKKIVKDLKIKIKVIRMFLNICKFFFYFIKYFGYNMFIKDGYIFGFVGDYCGGESI